MDQGKLILRGYRMRGGGGIILQAVGGGTIIGPMLLGLEKPVQIVQMNATVNDLVQAAAIAAHDTILTD